MLHRKPHPSLAGLKLSIAHFRSVPLSAVSKFDASMRDRSWTEPPWFPGLYAVESGAVPMLVEAVQDHAGAAMVLSCHPNGFVRERAISMLSRLPDPAALTIVLLRSADWVPAVRDAADRAFGPMWIGIDDDIAIVHLPLLWHLSTEGSRLSDAAKRAMEEFLGHLDAERTPFVAHVDQRVRRIVSTNCSARMSRERLVSLLRSESDPQTARTLARELFGSRSADAEVAKSLLNAPIGSVRAEALVTLERERFVDLIPALIAALLDSNAVVRSYAQHQLLAAGVDARPISTRRRSLLATVVHCKAFARPQPSRIGDSQRSSSAAALPPSSCAGCESSPGSARLATTCERSS